MARDSDPRCVSVAVPGLDAGAYRVTLFDTLHGEPIEERRVAHAGDVFHVRGVALCADVAIAITLFAAAPA